MDTEVTENPRMFQALRLLERVVPPRLYGNEPYWRAPITPPSRSVLVPSWTWRRFDADEIPEGEEPITVDINGAFLSALGAVQVAHGQLSNVGAVDADRFTPRYDTTVPPGYYRIRVPHWGAGATLVSPLGTSERLKTEREVWVAHPTLVLLLELRHEGTLADLEITDAWVSSRRCDFREWSKKLKEVRGNLLDSIVRVHPGGAPAGCKCPQACGRYNAFKEGYGAAFSMMLTGTQCKTRRPDWAHAVYAQHAAAAWRKAWRLTLIGPVLGMQKVDEITLLNSDLVRAIQKPKPPVKWDPTGRQLGHLKRKQTEPEPEKAAAESPDLIMSDDWGDLL